ncbi:MAG: hypothetical protein JO235_06480 [Chroococcidiopsidaceae cyanobacterium CP_BM_RX_35]|nr:hypothetical protein [Chroococcidiopsidaceae cyanobacterium CP_BM_RX_35]
MKRQVIGMMTTYPGLEQADWLWQQTPQAFGCWNKIQMLARTKEPDFLLLYQYDFVKPLKSQPKSWRRRLQRWLEPPAKPPQTPPESPLFETLPRDRVIYLLREPPLPEIVSLNQSNYEQAVQYCGYVSGPDDFAPVPDYMPAIWYHGNSFRELHKMPAPEKVKSCSWITSGIDRTANHVLRLQFLRLLREQELEFDLYGRGLPAWARAYGSVSSKWSAMAPYFYNLAIENYAENDWYVSEKLWDSLMAWCLPIYYGGVAADKLLPPGSFLRLPSLDERGLAFIQEVTATPDAWYQAQSAITEARQVILHKLNLLNWLSTFVERFIE